jgi:hypothetical protein
VAVRSCCWSSRCDLRWSCCSLGVGLDMSLDSWGRRTPWTVGGASRLTVLVLII